MPRNDTPPPSRATVRLPSCNAATICSVRHPLLLLGLPRQDRGSQNEERRSGRRLRHGRRHERTPSRVVRFVSESVRLGDDAHHVTALERKSKRRDEGSRKDVGVVMPGERRGSDDVVVVEESSSASSSACLLPGRFRGRRRAYRPALPRLRRRRLHRPVTFGIFVTSTPSTAGGRRKSRRS